MIVTQQMAEKAAEQLDLGLFGLSEASVRIAFREAAKRMHPDKGGTMDEFVQLDRAKEVLLRWINRPMAEPVDPAIASDKCQPCKGTGRRVLRRGFRSMTMVCGSCRGTGERVPPEKVEE